MREFFLLVHPLECSYKQSSVSLTFSRDCSQTSLSDNILNYEYSDRVKNVIVPIIMEEKECHVLSLWVKHLESNKQLSGKLRWRWDVRWLYLCSYNNNTTHIHV